MGWLKDLGKSIYKGIKKVGNALGRGIKSVAKRVKKISKKIITALPGGKKLWEVGGKIGTGLLKGMSKLGPLGTLALNFVVPGIGSFFSGLMSSAWGAFGAGAASWASSANAVISTLGKAGGYIFDSGNFIKGTMGAFGDAVSKGTDRLMSGDFSGAITDFSANIKRGITGDAGFAAVDAGRLTATSTLAKSEQLSKAYNEGTLGKDTAKIDKQLDAYDTALQQDPDFKYQGELTDRERFMQSLNAPDTTADLSGLKMQDMGQALSEGSQLNYQQSFVDPNMSLGKEVGKMNMKDWDAYFNYGGSEAVQQLNTLQQLDAPTRKTKENQRQQQITGGYADNQPLLSPFTGAARAVKMGQAVGGVGAQGSLMVNAGLQPIEALNRSLLAQVQRGY